MTKVWLESDGLVAIGNRARVIFAAVVDHGSVGINSGVGGIKRERVAEVNKGSVGTVFEEIGQATKIVGLSGPRIELDSLGTVRQGPVVILSVQVIKTPRDKRGRQFRIACDIGTGFPTNGLERTDGGISHKGLIVPRI
ncbi:MAG TPA: hypothetical protein VNX28_12515 [Gemmataceae bacterium]|nr:hypothetical protein [Gemmataceae bacterium]